MPESAGSQIRYNPLIPKALELMRQYLDFMRHVYEHGSEKTDRTGTGTRSVFGYQMRFNLQDGFPLLTTKKLHIKSIVHELIWFLAGPEWRAHRPDRTADQPDQEQS